MSKQKQFIIGFEQELVMKAGYDYKWKGTVKDWNDSTEIYDTVDISGGTFTMTILDKEGAAASFSNPTIVIVAPASNGIIRITFADTDTDSDDIGSYTYTIDYLESGGDKHQPVSGILTII